MILFSKPVCIPLILFVGLIWITDNHKTEGLNCYICSYDQRESCSRQNPPMSSLCPYDNAVCLTTLIRGYNDTETIYRRCDWESHSDEKTPTCRLLKCTNDIYEETTCKCSTDNCNGYIIEEALNKFGLSQSTEKNCSSINQETIGSLPAPAVSSPSLPSPLYPSPFSAPPSPKFRPPKVRGRAT